MKLLNINKEEGKEGGDRLSCSSSRLTINDFINDGPESPGLISNVSNEAFRGISTWQGENYRGTNIRISSKIFSQARNFRMNQIYTYEENTDYHYYNTFKCCTMFIEKMMEDGLDKVESTKEMANYIPLEDEMFQEYGKEKKREKQRLIYYSQDYDYSNNELQ